MPEQMPYIIYHHSLDGEDDGWTWLKWPSIPPEADREVIKARFQARFSRKRLAWYVRFFTPTERIERALGRPAEATIEGQRPIKAWPKGFRSQ